jgi:hypothetical protein
MPRFRSRFLVPAFALIAFGFLVPALAQALPLGGADLSAAERHEATTPGRLFQLWSLLSALWAETGSILDPDGSPAGTSPGAGAEANTGSAGDNGPGLDPNG